MTVRLPLRAQAEEKACPFAVDRRCLVEGCMAWDESQGCMLIPHTSVEPLRPFEQKVRDAAPLMYRSLLDLVRIMEDTARDCTRCGPDLWNYAQEVRVNLLDKLIQAELAELGIHEDKEE
jgi:hypothetical protein